MPISFQDVSYIYNPKTPMEKRALSHVNLEIAEFIQLVVDFVVSFGINGVEDDILTSSCLFIIAFISQ